MAELITIYWRDIPAQVIGRSGRTKVKRVLPSRFAEAIDTAAMRAGRGSSDAYLAEWRRDARPCKGNLDDAVTREVERLVNDFDDEKLRRVARNNGRHEEDSA
jgi:hypothetical protein